MRYPILLVSDTHFTSNPRDEYRWGLWGWMRARCKELGVRSVVILGDLSDAKDFHPSSLVNRIATEINELSKLSRIYAIPGNHEWLKRGEEFWRFISLMSDNIHYFTQPSDDPVPHKDGPVCRFLPFTKTPSKDWAGHSFEDYDFVFMHQTVKGSRSSNGQEMTGEDVPFEELTRAAFVFSGDIHVPQGIGKNFEYVGSPYHVHFGDSFKPRCVLLPGPRPNQWIDLTYPTISRVTLDTTADLESLADRFEDGKMRAGDQVKLRVHLEASERHEWNRIRREAISMLRKMQVEVHGIELLVTGAGQKTTLRLITKASDRSSTPSEDIYRYVMREELGADALDAAMEAIDG